MRYKVRVINAPSGLEMKEIPNPSGNTKAIISDDMAFIAIKMEKAFDDSLWMLDEATSYWVPYTIGKKRYLSIEADLEEDTDAMPIAAGTGDNGAAGRDRVNGYSGGYYPQQNQIRLKQSVTTNMRWNIQDPYASIPSTTKNLTDADLLNDPAPEIAKYIKTGMDSTPYSNTNKYPNYIQRVDGAVSYDYTMDLSDIRAAMDVVKKDMNIPFGDIYTPQKINKLMHSSFNRYRVVYPDYERQRLIPYIFFTRPDLNLFETGTIPIDEMKANPQLDYLILSNPLTAQCLTLDYTSAHKLNPLLSNRVQNFDATDDTLEVYDSIETFSGYKMKFGKNSVRSMTGGSMSFKFPETYNLAITVMHQIWVGYENAVYRGLLAPKTKYITGKILDYACDIFYFLADSSGMIWFWSQLYGAFPTSVNKSIFSYDEGSLVSFPSTSVTYEYSFRKDWDPQTIVDFNILCGITESDAPNMTTSNGPKYKYNAEYIPALGHSGRTWCGPPFIEGVRVDDGSGRRTQRFRIRFRPAVEDV